MTPPDEDTTEAVAYMVWRVDCERCEDVIDLDSGDEPGDTCPNDGCDAPIRLA